MLRDAVVVSAGSGASADDSPLAGRQLWDRQALASSPEGRQAELEEVRLGAQRLRTELHNLAKTARERANNL